MSNSGIYVVNRELAVITGSFGVASLVRGTSKTVTGTLIWVQVDCESASTNTSR